MSSIASAVRYVVQKGSSKFIGMSAETESDGTAISAVLARKYSLHTLGGFDRSMFCSTASTHGCARESLYRKVRKASESAKSRSSLFPVSMAAAMRIALYGVNDIVK